MGMDSLRFFTYGTLSSIFEFHSYISDTVPFYINNARDRVLHHNIFGTVENFLSIVATDLGLTLFTLFHTSNSYGAIATLLKSMQLFGIRVTQNPNYSLSISVINIIKSYFTELDCLPNLATASGTPTPTMSFMDFLNSNWKTLINSVHDKRFSYVFRLLAIFIITPLSSLAGFSVTTSSFDSYYTSFIGFITKHKELNFVTWVVELLIHFSSSCVNYFSTGDFLSSFSAIDKVTDWCESSTWLLDNEHNTSLSLDKDNPDLMDINFMKKLELTIAEGESLFKDDPIVSTRSYVSSTIKSDLTLLKSLLHRRRTIATIYAESREPLGILVYGIPGCGKSLISDIIFSTYASYRGIMGGREGIYNVTTFKEFWDGLLNSHWGLLLDDLGKEAPELGDSSALSIIIDVINGVGSIANMAHLEDKGKVALNFELVLGTTNVEHLNARAYYSVPMAIHRRFPIIIEVVVKPDFANADGSINRHAIAKYKRRNGLSLHSHVDAHTFIVKNPAFDSSVKFCPNVVGTFETYADLLQYLLPVFEFHHTEQTANVVARKKIYNSDICPKCNILRFVCGCPSNELVIVPVVPVTSSGIWSLIPPSAIANVTSYFRGLLMLSPIPGADLAMNLSYNWGGFVGGFTYVQLFLSGLNWYARRQGYYTICRSCLRTHIKCDLFSRNCQRRAGCNVHYPMEPDTVIRRFVDWRARTACGFADWRFNCGIGIGFIGISYYFKTRFSPKILRNKLRAKVFDEIKSTLSPEFVKSAAIAQLKSLKRSCISSNRGLQFVIAIGSFCAAGRAFVVLSRLYSNIPTSSSGVAPSVLKKTNAIDIDLSSKTPKATSYDTTNSNWLNSYRLPTLSQHGDKSRTILFSDFAKLVDSRICAIGLLETGSVTQLDSLAGQVGQYGILFHENLLLINKHFLTENMVPSSKYLLSVHLRGQDMVANKIRQIVSLSDFTTSSRDFCVVTLADLHPKSSLIPYFMRNYPSGSHPGMLLTVRQKLDCYTFEPEQCRMSTSGPEGFIDDLMIRFTSKITKGMCGLPLLIEGPQENVIVGPVCAGVPGADDGFALPITQDELRDLLTSHYSESCPVASSGYNLPVLTPVHPKSIFRFMTPDKSGSVYGSYTKNIATDKPSVKRSFNYDRIQAVYGPVDFIIPDLRTGMVTGRSWYSPYSNNICKRMLTNHPLDYSLVKICANHFGERFKSIALSEYLYPLSLHDSLNGIQGLTGINLMTLNTSAGFPLNGKKSDYVTRLSDQDPYTFTPEFKTHLDDVVSYLSQGKRYNFIFKAALKTEEPVKPAKHVKGKYRVFMVCPMALALLTRKYFLTFTRLFMLFKEESESSVGISERSPDWTYIASIMKKHPNYFDGDFSSFDAYTPKGIIIACFDLLIKLALMSGNYSSQDITIMKVLAVEITYFYCCVRGVLCSFSRSNASGHSLTTLINGMVNSILMRICWWLEFGDLTAYDDNFALITLGDDQICSVSNLFSAFNVLTVQKHMRTLGMIYTPADKDEEDPPPFIPFEDLSFLQRKFVKHTGFKYYRAPLRRISITRSLSFEATKSPISSMQHCFEVLNNSIFESSQFSLREQQDFVAKAQLVYEADLKSNPALGPLVTIDQILEQWDYLTVRD